MVGSNPASQIYVNIKEKRALEAGMKFTLVKLKETISENDLIKNIIKLNKNKNIDGFLVQIPLPKKFNEDFILNHIAPEKDMDGLHPINIGKLVMHQEAFIPCTPAGIIEMIRSVKYDLQGKKAVIIGRSNIVGKPISFLLLHENCTVTICHSRTRNLPEEVKKADVVVAAIGRPEFVKGTWIKKGAMVIDVGINRIEDKKAKRGYRIMGDVEYKKARTSAAYITPVPGGVGPMTVALLLKNVLKAYTNK